MNECTLLLMVIKALDSNLNLDERFSLTKTDKVWMKKRRQKKVVDRQRILHIDSVV